MKRRILATLVLLGLGLYPSIGHADTPPVVDKTGQISNGTMSSMIDRSTTLSSQNGIHFEVVIVKEGNLSAIANSYQPSAPAAILVVNTKTSNSYWRTSGLTAPNPTRRIDSLYLRGGRNTGNWDEAVGEADQYAAGVLQNATLPVYRGQVTSSLRETSLAGGIGILAAIGAWYLYFRTFRKKSGRKERTR